MTEVIIRIKPGRLIPADRTPRAQLEPRELSYTAIRNRLIRRATPKWADLRAIERLYAKARAKTRHTGKLHHVDHVIPIQGNNVCGLHVETNLRIVRARVNLIKRNRFSESDLLDSAPNIRQSVISALKAKVIATA